MNRTTRRLLPAVVVLLALTTGLTAAATYGSADRKAEREEPVRLTAEVAETTTTTIKTAQDRPVATPQRSSTTRPATHDTTVRPAPQPSTALSASPERAASDPRAACSTSVGGYHPSTEAEFHTAITRAWLLCQPPSIFGTSEAGIEIRADGTWSKLESKSNGVLERTEGWGNEGAWETVDTSIMNGPGSFQLNLRVDGNVGTYPTIPAFGDGSQASAVTKLELVTEGAVADYVPVPRGTHVVPAPAGPPPAPGDRCDTRTDASFSPPTQAEFESAIVGAWLLCGETSVFGTYDAGLLISADGRWSKLQRRADGSLVATRGPADAGTWESIDVSAMNGRPLFQLNLAADRSVLYTIPAFAVHRNHVSKVRLDSSGVSVADYVPLPAGTPIAMS